VRAACQHSIEYAERRFREEVSSWPDGVYEADAWVDHDPIGNPDIRVHVKVTVDGDRLKVDFTGSDTRQDLKAYSSFGNTRGYVVAQLASMMDPAIPKNEGFFNSIEPGRARGLRAQSRASARRSRRARTTRASRSARRSARRSRRCCPSAPVPQIYKLGMPT
jgi:N-methylhydantoinase B